MVQAATKVNIRTATSGSRVNRITCWAAVSARMTNPTPSTTNATNATANSATEIVKYSWSRAATETIPLAITMANTSGGGSRRVNQRGITAIPVWTTGHPGE